MKKNTLSNTLKFLHQKITVINNSKIFAGLMIITLNIVSRFVDIKLSKSMESFLKYTFSKYLLVFTIAWMGSRDIYIALAVMTIYIICMDCLFDDDSIFCILPEGFKVYHNELREFNEEVAEITDDDIVKAKKILKLAKERDLNDDLDGYVI